MFSGKIYKLKVQKLSKKKTKQGQVQLGTFISESADQSITDSTTSFLFRYIWHILTMCLEWLTLTLTIFFSSQGLPKLAVYMWVTYFVDSNHRISCSAQKLKRLSHSCASIMIFIGHFCRFFLLLHFTFSQRVFVFLSKDSKERAGLSLYDECTLVSSLMEISVCIQTLEKVS